jgi:RNA polymerase sigma-54 factor
MQKLGLSQSLQQKLSPQQIQFIKLLQVPTAELESRIEEELEVNPALEEGEEKESPDDNTQDEQEEDVQETSGSDEELDIKDYLRDDDYSGYKMQGDGDEDDDRDLPIPMSTSLHEQLMTQLDYLGLDEKQYSIGKQLIGSIEADGYIRRDLEAIVNDLAFSLGIETTYDEVEAVLKKIQTFDPAGIAARTLQECLLLQLDRMDNGHDIDVAVGKKIIAECFEEFTKKHYAKIQKKLDTEDEDFVRDAIELIVKLNPKPGGGGGAGSSVVKNQYIIPDFILTNNNGKLELALNSRNAPELRISRSYTDMFKAYDKSDKKDKKLKEAVTFVKQKLDAAKWFIDAIKQRQQTLLRTMKAIIDFQYEFFLEGEETKLKPMILKDIASMINMDISTVSRVASSKAVQTDFGIFPLKYFFSEGITTDSGEEVSSREVKQIIKDIIEAEDKDKPLSDDKLEKILNDKGYNIARRTVAKYREQLNIPVARLRKEI